ncbi:MFS transporter [Photorhabdus kayaii]|uniref:MFS transporter n=1 Tax=Photorhabdus kayaii TaxID=230088 RepID=UPI0021D49025|nr:MFS transporter [Photorhabdus kayaii]MCT8351758.1 MFS transporter [Photorhabdus kayaii]
MTLLKRESIQYYRYYLVNVGAAIGPYIGLASGLSAQRETFLITAIVYFVYGIILRVFLLSSKKEEKIKKFSNDISFTKTLNIIISHRTFMILLLCNVLVMFVYANFDSTLVQYLSRSNINNVTNFIALLVIVNSLTIITLQIPTLVLLRNFTPRIKILIGIMLIAIAQIIFAFSPINTVYYLCVATVILSFGEIIAIPTFNVEVDRLTPHHLRGAFFGAYNMSSIGSALAPIYGGIMLDLFNSTLLFSLLSLISLITLLIYYTFLIKKNN